VIFHTFVFMSCYVLATLARFDFHFATDQYAQMFHSSLPVVISVQLFFGTVFGFHRGWWRYVGMSVVLRLVAGTGAAFATLEALWYFDPALTGISRGVLLIDWAFAVLTLFGARVLVRLAHNRMRDQSVGSTTGMVRRVIIIGAGDAGEALAREIEHRPQLGMRVVGFVDDKPTKWHSQIRGIKVRGPISSIAPIAEELGAEEALIAIPTAPGPRIREIIHELAEAKLEFKTIPGMDQLVTGKVQATQLRAVNMEDLLRRQKIQLPGDPVRELFRDQRVLISGAGGTIGSELVVQVLEYEPEHITLVERSEYALYQARRRVEKELPQAVARISTRLVDIQDQVPMRELIASKAPHIVLHAAAHKHVPLGEENPAEYLRNNCIATRKLAEICDQAGVKRFVFISTDKAINPTSVMGATKRAAEIALVDLAHRSKMKMTSVRFGNVLGSSGSVIPLFLEQIASGGPITVTHPDVTRYFLRTSEAVSLVLQAATLGTSGHVFMLDMGEPIKIADLARDLIRLSNHTEDQIPIVFTGLRQGEKLFEEVRLSGEFNHPTLHPQIVITEAPQPDTATVAKWLSSAEYMSSRIEVIDALRVLIPEYKPSEGGFPDLPQMSEDAAPSGVPIYPSRELTH
jgi:FlaA1/EpsC-like NDP-sugar epimerase